MSIDLNLSTYLSDYVKELISSVEIREETKELDEALVINKQNIIDTDYISKICIKYNDDNSVDYFNSSKVLSANIYICCKNIENLFTEKVFEVEFNTYFSFISKFVIDENEFSILKRCFEESIITIKSSPQHQIQVYLSLLNIFTIFEHNLRQLISTIAQKNDFDLLNQFLLRDLISNKSLAMILSPGLINIIKLFVGSPLSLNLRNLMWHGFLLPAECSHYYEYFFYLILNRIGYEVDSYEIKSLETKRICQINFISEDLFDKIIENMDEHLKCVNKTMLLNDQQKNLVCYTIQDLFLKRKSFIQVIMICLPQIEFLLRKLYIIENKIDFKFNLCAQEKFYYLTMDEILQERVILKNEDAKIGISNEINKLRFKLGDEFMLLLYDLFMFNDGPRIRDRFSHGEYQLNYEIDNENNFKQYGFLCIRIISYLANNDSLQISNSFSAYKCHYHPLAIIKINLINLITFLISKCSNEALNIEQNCLEFIDTLLIDNKIIEIKNLRNLIDYLNEISINSKYLFLYSKHNMNSSHNNSLQIINIIKKLINECFTFLETIYIYNETTKIKQDNKQLRARQRETFKYFQENSLMIKFELSTKDVILILITIYSILINNNNKIFESKIEWYVKIFRKFLTIYQNLSQQSKINRWLECIQLINELYKIFAVSNP